MKKFQNIIVAVSIAICFFGCEKDDICPETTPTTPRVIIEFFDKGNPTIAKKVTNLRVVGAPNTEGINFNPTLTGDLKFLANVDRIALPLKTTSEITEYTFTLNAGADTPTAANADKLTVNYITQEIYVSRACGYRTVFDLADDTLIEDNSDTSRWIQNIIVENYKIETENEAHIKIYF